MDEVFQQLLENDLLNEETSNALKEAFETKMNEAVQAATEKAETETKAKLVEQFVEEKDALIEALDSKVETALQEELAELKDDIDRFRDLEVEKEKEMADYRKKLSEDLTSDMEKLVENLDSFIDLQLANEFEELRESIDEVRKQQFGRKIVEAFKDEFALLTEDEDSRNELEELKTQLQEKTELLESIEKKNRSAERTAKMNSLLENLNGRPREIMEMVLKSEKTEKLDEAYEKYIGRVLQEHEESVSEKESDNEVLAESESDSDDVQVVTGDDEERLVKEAQLQEESEAHKSSLTPEQVAWLRRQAGISV